MNNTNYMRNYQEDDGDFESENIGTESDIEP